MFATWIWAVCANLCGRCELSSCAFNCLSKQMLIMRAKVWRLIDVLTEANYSFSKAYSIHLHYGLCYSLHKQCLAKFNWVILSQITQLIQVNETSHDNTEWDCCRKVGAKREVMCKGYLPQCRGSQPVDAYHEGLPGGTRVTSIFFTKTWIHSFLVYVSSFVFK